MAVPGADESSFWADRMRDAHPVPFRYGEKIEIPPPDDVGTAALDECESAFDELEAVAGQDLADILLDAIEDRGDHAPSVAARVLDHFRLTRAPEVGWHGLVEAVNIYGAAIEYDLWDRGYDLLDYFRGARDWDHLLRVISRLPMGSHYRAAVADDDALAERVVELYGPLHKRKGSGRPPLTEFDRHAMYLHRIDNRLGYLAWAVFAAQAGKKRGQPPKGDKGPETADERVEFRGFLAEHEEIVSQVLKDKGQRQPPAEAVRGAVMLDHPPAIGQSDEDEGVTDG